MRALRKVFKRVDNCEEGYVQNCFCDRLRLETPISYIATIQKAEFDFKIHVSQQ